MKLQGMAKELGVCSSTVNNWCRKGLIPCIKTEDGGHFYDVDAVKAAYDAMVAEREKVVKNMTTVSLTAEQRAFVGRLAERDAVSFSEVVRKLIDAELAKGAA